MLIIKADCLKLSELRIKQGMSQAEFARTLGVARQTMNMVEKGRINPTPFLAKNIADNLGIEFDEIFSIVEGD